MRVCVFVHVYAHMHMYTYLFCVRVCLHMQFVQALVVKVMMDVIATIDIFVHALYCVLVRQCECVP